VRGTIAGLAILVFACVLQWAVVTGIRQAIINMITYPSPLAVVLGVLAIFLIVGYLVDRIVNANPDAP
jgi:hypothetical protein